MSAGCAAAIRKIHTFTNRKWNLPWQIGHQLESRVESSSAPPPQPLAHIFMLGYLCSFLKLIRSMTAILFSGKTKVKRWCRHCCWIHLVRNWKEKYVPVARNPTEIITIVATSMRAFYASLELMANKFGIVSHLSLTCVPRAYYACTSYHVIVSRKRQ